MVTNYLDDLIVFVRVVELKAFAAVAENLGLPPSVISKQITRLEKNVGARLLNRTTHGVSLTEIGRAIYEHACNILLESKAIDGLISGFQRVPSGLLRVASPVAFGIEHIVPCIAEFQKRNPKVLLSLELSNQYIDLAEDGVDLVIRIADALSQNLRARPLAKIRYILCASPAYLNLHGTPDTLEDLQQQKCLIYGRHRVHDIWHFIDETQTKISVKVVGGIVVNSTEALRTLVLQDQGIALLPSFSVGKDIKKGNLRVILPQVVPQGQFGNMLYAAYLPNPFLSPKVRVFIDFLVERFGNEPYWDDPTGDWSKSPPTSGSHPH